MWAKTRKDLKMVCSACLNHILYPLLYYYRLAILGENAISGVNNAAVRTNGEIMDTQCVYVDGTLKKPEKSRTVAGKKQSRTKQSRKIVTSHVTKKK